jgi:hypothetical protein
MLFDRQMEKPATDFAVALVRQYWKNNPLELIERVKAGDVVNHNRFSCNLRSICSWFRNSAHLVDFLYQQSETIPKVHARVTALAPDEYTTQKSSNA